MNSSRHVRSVGSGTVVALGIAGARLILILLHGRGADFEVFKHLGWLDVRASPTCAASFKRVSPRMASASKTGALRLGSGCEELKRDRPFFATCEKFADGSIRS
jgi:hypothetical protein